MKNVFNKKNIVLGWILIVSVLVFSVSVSYAYFSASVSGNSKAYDTVITTGTMRLAFIDGSQVEVNNLLPGSSIQKEFSVTNTGTLKTEYDVYFSELLNMFSNKDELVYTISSLNGCSNSTETAVPDNSGEKMISQCSINPGQTHNYTMIITFKETDEIQNGNKGKFVDFKISVNEYKNLFESVLINDGQQVNNVSALKSSNLNTGTRVRTLGYYSEDDGGQASYLIEDKGSQIIDDGKYIELDNGKVAKLLYNNAISVKQYGAVGDNSTDDSTAVVNIFANLADNETVFVPNGTYIVNSEMGVFHKNNIRIIGEGNESIFKAKEGLGQNSEIRLLYFYGNNNVAVSKIALSGNYPTNNYTNIRMFDMWDCSNILVDKVKIYDNGGEAIRLIVNTENVSVTNSIFNTTDCGIIAMGDGNIKGLIVENNTFDGHQNSEPVSLFGVGQYSDIYINNNRILNKTYGQALYLGNYFNGNGEETQGKSELSNVIITNNIVRNSGGITIKHASNLLIDNNDIYNDEPLNIGGSFGFSIEDSTDVIISNNVIENVKMNGLGLNSLSNAKIYGNKITNSGYLNINYFFADIRGQNNNVDVYNNEFIRADLENESLSEFLVVVHGDGGVKLYDNTFVNGRLRLWSDATNIYVSNCGDVFNQGTNNTIIQ